MENETIKRIIDLTVIKNCIQVKEYYVPVAISARHVHLSTADVEALFGKGHTLKKIRDLIQPGQFACEEQVTFVGAKGKIEKMRVLGPVRKETQVEISMTDSYKAGVEPFVRMSGDLKSTPGGRLIGPAGEVALLQGVIVSARHLHMSADEASWFGLKNGDTVSVKKTGVREVVFSNVLVRSGEGHALEMHIDTDEANAAGMNRGELLQLIK